jgi:hypothetical protein
VQIPFQSSITSKIFACDGDPTRIRGILMLRLSVEPVIIFYPTQASLGPREGRGLSFFRAHRVNRARSNCVRGCLLHHRAGRPQAVTRFIQYPYSNTPLHHEPIPSRRSTKPPHTARPPEIRDVTSPERARRASSNFTLSKCFWAFGASLRRARFPLLKSIAVETRCSHVCNNEYPVCRYLPCPEA